MILPKGNNDEQFCQHAGLYKAEVILGSDFSE